MADETRQRDIEADEAERARGRGRRSRPPEAEAERRAEAGRRAPRPAPRPRPAARGCRRAADGARSRHGRARGAALAEGAPPPRALASTQARSAPAALARGAPRRAPRRAPAQGRQPPCAASAGTRQGRRAPARPRRRRSRSRPCTPPSRASAACVRASSSPTRPRRRSPSGSTSPAVTAATRRSCAARAPLHAHDENNDAHEGDVVRVIESRPLSSTKRWELVDVLERAR